MTVLPSIEGRCAYLTANILVVNARGCYGESDLRDTVRPLRIISSSVGTGCALKRLFTPGIDSLSLSGQKKEWFICPRPLGVMRM